MKTGLKIGLWFSGIICFMLVITGIILYNVSNNYIKSMYIYNGENMVYGLSFDEVNNNYTVTNFLEDEFLNDIDSGDYNRDNNKIILQSNTGNEIIAIDNLAENTLVLNGVINNRVFESAEFGQVKNIMELIKIVEGNSKK